ncbi:MAG: hypothetical protein LBB80_05960 [Treponema sp.]|nr:hypothetical protein [Treponema sp.]
MERTVNRYCKPDALIGQTLLTTMRMGFIDYGSTLEPSWDWKHCKNVYDMPLFYKSFRNYPPVYTPSPGSTVRDRLLTQVLSDP